MNDFEINYRFKELNLAIGELTILINKNQERMIDLNSECHAIKTCLEKNGVIKK